MAHHAGSFLARGLGLRLLLNWWGHRSFLCKRTNGTTRQNDSRYRESYNARVHLEPPSETCTPTHLIPYIAPLDPASSPGGLLFHAILILDLDEKTPPALVVNRKRWPRCQSALEWDPLSASKRDPFDRRVLMVALAAELAGVVETARARVV